MIIHITTFLVNFSISKVELKNELIDIFMEILLFSLICEIFGVFRVLLQKKFTKTKTKLELTQHGTAFHGRLSHESIGVQQALERFGNPLEEH